VASRTRGERVRAIALALGVVTLVAVAMLAVASRIRFGTMAFWGYPDRIEYCGRRYYGGSDVAGKPSSLSRGGGQDPEWKRIDRTYVGRPIYAAVDDPNGPLCTMSLYVPRGEGEYRSYSLSGGP
jgi:hypothetical protein